MFKLPENLESKYRFVTLASKRAEQLQLGALPRIEDANRKVTVLAQAEVASGVIEVWDPTVEEAETAAALEEQEVE